MYEVWLLHRPKLPHLTPTESRLGEYCTFELARYLAWLMMENAHSRYIRARIKWPPVPTVRHSAGQSDPRE